MSKPFKEEHPLGKSKCKEDPVDQNTKETLFLFVELPSKLVKRAGMNLSTLFISVYSSNYFQIYTNRPWFSWVFGSKVLTLVASGRRYVHVED